MVAMNPPFAFRRQRGVSMIEVLVTIVILGLGIMGLIGLQSRMQISELESYQRAQALILLQDMANRIATNRGAAGDYVTGSEAPLGTGHTCTVSGTLQQRDSCAWSEALLGSAEKAGNTNVGTLIGGRGCVEDLGNDEYLITVTWQSMVPGAPPPAGVACGRNLYDAPSGSGSACTADRCRRAVTTLVRIGSLT